MACHNTIPHAWLVDSVLMRGTMCGAGIVLTLPLESHTYLSLALHRSNVGDMLGIEEYIGQEMVEYEALANEDERCCLWIRQSTL